MDTQKIDLYLLTNGKYFPAESLPVIHQKLELADESKSTVLSYMQFKDPTLALVLSVLVGTLGIDRFYIDDILLGVLKLITAGGCGVWWLVDLFLIQNATKRKNFEKFMQSTLTY